MSVHRFTLELCMYVWWVAWDAYQATVQPDVERPRGVKSGPGLRPAVQRVETVETLQHWPGNPEGNGKVSRANSMNGSG